MELPVRGLYYVEDVLKNTERFIEKLDELEWSALNPNFPNEESKDYENIRANDLAKEFDDFLMFCEEQFGMSLMPKIEHRYFLVGLYWDILVNGIKDVDNFL